MDKILSALQISGFDWSTFWKAASLTAFIVLVLGLIGKLFFKKNTILNHAVSSAVGILFIYAMIIVFHSIGGQFQKFALPLPLVFFFENTMQIFSFLTSDYTAICSQVLSLIMLAFLVNLIDGFMSKGKNLFGWIVLRILVVVLAALLHAGSVWLQNRFVPAGLLTYAPTILLGLLVLLLAVSALKPLVSLLLAVTTHPLIVAFYSFFFATIVGKALTKAILTCAIICALVYALNCMGIAAISITAAALIAYIPLLIALLIIWYVVNKIF